MKGGGLKDMRTRMSRRADISKGCLGSRASASRESRAPSRDEKGFSLIELIIVISIIPIIVGAISGGLIAVLSLQNGVSSRLADTADAQVVSSTFIKDVQSATFITTKSSSSPQCGSSTYTQLLGLQWGNTPGSSSDPSTLVSYDIVPVTVGSTTTYSLVREYCTQGNYATPSSSATVSYDIAATQPPPCYSGAACNPYDLVHNPQIGWTSPSATVGVALVMPVVRFVITEVQSGLVVTLAANSRSWTPAAAQGITGPAFSPLTLLDQTVPSLTLNSASVLTVTGTGTTGKSVAFASTSDGAGTISIDGDLNAQAVFTEDPNLASLSGPGLGGSTPEYYAASIGDPLSSLFNSSTAPTAASPWPLSGTSCSKSGLTYTCGSGLYNADPGFPSGSTVCFCDAFGTYEFAQTFVIPTNSTMTFDKGEYVFDGSPAIAPGSALGNQTLTWTSTPPASPSTTSPNNTYTPTATSNAGLPVTFTSETTSVCTVASGVVTFKSNGICLIDGNQPGNNSWNPADQIQQVIPIPKSANTPQTITVSTTKPSPATINSTYTPAATASSTLAVSFAVTPSSVCSLTGGVVTFTAAGTCLINASQSGGSKNGKTYLQAPVVQQAVVVIAGSGATTITGNNVLFYVPSSGGSIDFGNTASVTLTPLASGMSIWDASSGQVTINNVANNRNSFGGIYAPGGNVNVTSNSLTGSMSVMFVVANTMSMAAQTTLNVTGP